MDLAARLECPQWAWPSFQRAFGAAGVETELRALQAAPPLDLRVNTLRASRTQALAEIRAAGLPAPTLRGPRGRRKVATKGVEKESLDDAGPREVPWAKKGGT